MKELTNKCNENIIYSESDLDKLSKTIQDIIINHEYLSYKELKKNYKYFNDILNNIDIKKDNDNDIYIKYICKINVQLIDVIKLLKREIYNRKVKNISAFFLKITTIALIITVASIIGIVGCIVASIMLLLYITSR